MLIIIIDEANGLHVVVSSKGAGWGGGVRRRTRSVLLSGKVHTHVMLTEVVRTYDGYQPRRLGNDQ